MAAAEKVTPHKELAEPKEDKAAVYREVDGYFVSPAFTDELIREALNYQPRAGDIFIVGYPKCGTSWMQYIVYNILHQRPPPTDLLGWTSAMPFLEWQGTESTEAMPRPAAIKTHMAFHLHPYSKEAKYIYITRNPYDCCVSFYYHTKGMSGYSFKDGTFDEFFDMFVEGRVDIGDYFEHVLSWYEHRFDDNVLFMTYEDLKKDTTAWIIRIADFIGEKYGCELRENKGALSRLISNTSVATRNEGRERQENETAVYREIDGYAVGPLVVDELVREALGYKPRPDDIFIVSYPKCGTTWMQHIVYSILNKGPPPTDLLERTKAMPFLELQGAASAEAMPRPGAIKTRMPFHLHPYSKEAKYIYITRNPYDCCVSFYYHTKGFPHNSFENGTFDQFFDLFIEGRLSGGDYFEHVLSWYKRRFDDNVLFVTYEELQKDTVVWIIRIADFIGEEYGYELRHNRNALSRIVSNTSVRSMQTSVNDFTRNVRDHLQVIPEDKKPRWIQLVEEQLGQEIINKPITADFVRKGIVGDWRNHFTPEHMIRMKRRMAVKTAASNVMSLWEDVGLP
ncbi:hypothetical protein HPB50_015803 [Hyalomma asiaticum]|uniref:Uncharacterized protein n=1 Tax=Hyalomma asiaticum TaxID=266040 RepID=A0ACB7RU06_HYAAI|nr:hypothetical protein HPB50_015803 [Hyalomma asiaticum]